MKLLALLCSVPLALACIQPNPSPPRPTAAPPTGGSCRCGVSKSRSSKIVGGVDAEKNEFPWQVLLVTSSGSKWCGGSLISTRTVLTAAHCRRQGLDAVVGEHDFSTSDGEQRIDIIKWEDHPDYEDGTYVNDFAIATLARPVTFTDKIYPICLPTGSSSSYENRDAKVTGWGAIYSGGPGTNILQKVDVRTMSNAACRNTGYSSSEITSEMICASESGKDSCQGDSGGPLIVKKSGANYFEQAGVVSWGIGCALPDYPGVYARVTSQLTWIKSKMTGTTCPTP